MTQRYSSIRVGLPRPFVPGAIADPVVTSLARNGVDLMALGPDSLRVVTHLHIADADIDRAITAFQEVSNQFSS